MRKTIRGYMDFGGIHIPPLAPGMALTDRGDGTVWLLSHNSSPSPGYISITDSWNSGINPHVYEAYGEPYMGTHPRIRLLVRDGYLGYEIEDLTLGITDRDKAPHLTRTGFQRATYQLYVPSSWQNEPDVLAWDVFEALP